MHNKLLSVSLLFFLFIFSGCSNIVQKRDILVPSISKSDEISYFGFPENSSFLFISDCSGNVKIINVKTNSSVNLKLSNITAVNTIVCNTSSQLLYFGGNSNFIEEYDTNSFTPKNKIATSYTFISSLSISNGKIICSGSSSYINIFSFDGNLLSQFKPSNAEWINKTVLNSSANKLSCWDSSDSIFIVDYRTGIVDAKIIINPEYNSSIKDVKFSKTDDTLIFSNGDNIYFGNMKEGSIDSYIDTNDFVSNIFYNEETKNAYIFTKSLLLYDTLLKKTTTSIPLDFTYKFSAFEPNEKYAVFYLNNGELRIIKIKNA